MQWSVRMADSETARLGDKFVWRKDKPAKWDCTVGLRTPSLLKLNEVVPTPGYIPSIL